MQETRATIIAHAILMGIAAIFNCIVMFLLIKHFYRKPLKHTTLKVLSITSALALIFLTTINCVLFNNSTIPSLHNTLHIMENHAHCHIVLIVGGAFKLISEYCIWVFLLCKINIFFATTPFKLSPITFYLHICLYTCIIVYICIALATHDCARIYIGSDDINYSLCFPATVQEDGGIFSGTIYGFLLMYLFDSGFIEMVLLCILHYKTKQLERYQVDHAHLSPYFSQRDQELIDLKIIKQCFFGGIVALICSTVALMCWFFLGIKFSIALTYGTDILPVICSFDIELNLCGSESQTQGEDKNEVELQQAREEYLRRIMNEYYKVPKRTLLPKGTL
eukprot:281362_1